MRGESFFLFTQQQQGKNEANTITALVNWTTVVHCCCGFLLFTLLTTEVFGCVLGYYYYRHNNINIIFFTMKFILAAFIPVFASAFTAPAAFTSNQVASTNTVATKGVFGVKSTTSSPVVLRAKEGDADFEKKKIIVLGGDGFCGWPTCLHLSDAGHDIVMVDNLSRRNIDTELGCSSLTPIQPPEVRLLLFLEIL